MDKTQVYRSVEKQVYVKCWNDGRSSEVIFLCTGGSASESKGVELVLLSTGVVGSVSSDICFQGHGQSHV